MIRRIYIALIILIAIVVGLIALGYWGSMSKQVELRTIEMANDNKITLGEGTTLVAKFNLPWSAKLLNVEITPPDNVIVAGTPSVDFAGLRFGFGIYGIQAFLQSIGMPENIGKITVYYKQDGKNRTLIVDLPQLEGQEGSQDISEEPELAGEVAILARFSLGAAHYIGLLIALLGLLAWVFYRKSRQKIEEQCLSVRSRAMKELDSLSHAVKSGSMPLDYAVFRLSDVVRGYLEARYTLPASRRTTEEFLAALRLSKGIFATENRVFLEEFMRTGDLIKFAKEHLEESLVIQALGNAEELVESTSPEEEKQNNRRQVQ